MKYINYKTKPIFNIQGEYLKQNSWFCFHVLDLLAKRCYVIQHLVKPISWSFEKHFACYCGNDLQLDVIKYPESLTTDPDS